MRLVAANEATPKPSTPRPAASTNASTRHVGSQAGSAPACSAMPRTAGYRDQLPSDPWGF
jgi:hypothetical protein